jgi:hypothetical protein
MEGWDPQPPHPKDAHNFFIRLLFTKSLQERYKDQTEATVLAIDRYTYKADEGGSHEQGPMPCHHTDAHHLKPKASTSYPSPSYEHSRSSRLSASTHVHTSEVAAAIFHEPISERINVLILKRLTVNATTTHDNATILCKSIKPRPSPRPYCAMLPGLTIVDKVDANRTFLKTPPGITCSKMMPQEVERHQK